MMVGCLELCNDFSKFLTLVHSNTSGEDNQGWMTRKNSMTLNGDNPGARPYDAASFWDGILTNRISRLGTVPSPEQYSSATTTTIETLEEEERVLQSVIDPILSRYYDEERVLKFILERFREYRRCQEYMVGSSLAAIRHCRNRFIPVARLPPEILSRIFVFTTQMVPHKDWVDAARTISHVCRRWREIALDCPKLWSQIDFEHNPRWLARVIGRSRSTPLSFLGEVQWNEETTALVVSNMHRFKSIDLRIPHDENCDVDPAFEMFNQSAPMLQHLTFTSYCPYSMYAFPHDFLGGCTPNLRHMKLYTESAHVPWNSGIFVNLTTLEVSGDWFEDRVVNRDLSSLEMLLDALMEMPGLKLLVLRNCIPLAHSMMERAHVDLPNLERLELAGSSDCCAGLLRQITINASTTVILHLDCTRWGDFRRFLDVFPSLSAAAIPTKALNFTSNDYYFGIWAWSIQQGLGVKDSENPRICLLFCWDEDYSICPPDIIWHCFSAFASPQLQSFRMSGDHGGWDVDLWRNLSDVAQNLQRVAVDEVAPAAGLCEALQPPGGPDTVPGDCCLPTLSYLELGARYDQVISTLDGRDTLLSAALADSLAARAAIGCPTPELVFIVQPPEELPEGWSEPLRKAMPGIIVRESHGLDDGAMPA